MSSYGSNNNSSHGVESGEKAMTDLNLLDPGGFFFFAFGTVLKTN